jgi:hypothetical protein
LSFGFEQIDVVTAHKILSQVDNRHGQTLFSVMIRSLFGDISNELSDL